MTKKDYIVIAKTIASIPVDGDESLRDHLIYFFSEKLSEQYPNFKPDTFAKYIKELRNIK